MSVQVDLSQMDLVDAIRTRQVRQASDSLKSSVTAFIVIPQWNGPDAQERFDAGLPPDDFSVDIQEQELTPEQAAQARLMLAK